jgi:chemotaxis protein MotB
MADKSKVVIVRKVKKGHGEAHGGSWKVAYADFVTAMMAFFLLLWLISMVSPEKRAAVADYFKNYNLFKEGGTSFMEQSSSIKQEITTSTESATGTIQMREVKEKLKSALAEKLKGLQKQVLIDQLENGLRIQIVDLEGRPMFNPGSAVPTERCKQILKVVSESIKGLDIRIAVEGHTDSSGSKKGRDSNWELSSARASTARKMLENNEIDQSLIAKVVGYADTDLLYKDKPTDPQNRRISLILMPPREKPEEIKTEPVSKPEPLTLPIVPPTIAPPPTQEKPAPVIEDKKPAPTKEKYKKKVIDPDIKPQKPIDIRPTLFPNMNQ